MDTQVRSFFSHPFFERELSEKMVAEMHSDISENN
jgi:hypothetical protein